MPEPSAFRLCYHFPTPNRLIFLSPINAFPSTPPIVWLAHCAPLRKDWCCGLGCEEQSHPQGHVFLSRETQYSQAGCCVLLIKKKLRHSMGFIIPSPEKRCAGLHPVSSELGHLLGWNFFLEKCVFNWNSITWLSLSLSSLQAPCQTPPMPPLSSW